MLGYVDPDDVARSPAPAPPAASDARDRGVGQVLSHTGAWGNPPEDIVFVARMD